MYTIEELAKELNCDTETLLGFVEKKYIRPVTQDGEVYFYSKDTLKDLQENFNKYLTQLQKDTLDMQRMAETEELFNEMEITYQIIDKKDKILSKSLYISKDFIFIYLLRNDVHSNNQLKI